MGQSITAKAGIFSLAASLALVASPAGACGGLFCSSSSPVNQAAERIIFAQDEDENITQIVEISYSGEAEKFAWVLPVPGTPTPGVSSAQVFDQVQASTNPIYQLNTDRKSCGIGFGAQLSNSAPAAEFSGNTPAIQILDSGQVGPFNYDTIRVDTGDSDPAEVAVEWLDDNGYDLGPRGAEVLRPYLESGLNLIAFRLTKGTSTGAIRPISLEYKAKEMSIPILPTAVAAQADMPILVWILGEARAVPLNYKSLELNELLINWFNPGPSYNQVVNAAADEAGGQGFVTEFAGSPASAIDLRSAFPLDVRLVAARGNTLVQQVSELARNYGGFDGFSQAATEHLGIAESDMPNFISCTACYFDLSEIDLGMGGGTAGNRSLEAQEVDAFMAELEKSVVGPLIDAADLFDNHSKVTRLYTTMSADEMDLDPAFSFNPELGDVSNVHTAEQVIYCDDDFRITLPDGRKVFGTGSVWPFVIGESEMPANARVLQHSVSGPGTVLTDNQDAIKKHYKDSKADKRGGCSTGGGPTPGPVPWGVFVAVALSAGASMRRTKRTALRPERS